MDKVQKIREGIKKLKSQLIRGACSSQVEMETHCKEEAYNEVLAILDTMQEEPVSKQKLSNVEKTVKDWKEPVSEELEKVSDKYSEDIESDYSNDMFDRGDIMKAFEAGANWQREKDESTTEDLGKYINELSKQFPEVSFAKLSRIAVRVAKWQKKQIMKDTVEAKVYNKAYPTEFEIQTNTFMQKLKHGDKVKMILIKED